MSEGRGFEKLGFGVAEGRDALTGLQTEGAGREAFSTNIWLHLEGCVWRPGTITADYNFGSHRESKLPELAERWDMEPTRRVLINNLQSEVDFFDNYELRTTTVAIVWRNLSIKRSLRHIVKRTYEALTPARFRTTNCRQILTR